jgi:cell division transport system ATP-binding protein
MAKRSKPQYDIPKDNVITIRNVCKSYAKGAPALNGVSLDVKQGEFVFIVGDSGSGKSTLIKLLLRELTPNTGYINVLGYDLGRIRHGKIPKFRRNLGVVFQDFRLLKDRNVYENVAFAQRIIQEPSSRIKKNVPRILATVGLADKYKSKPSELSGGEQQRVALARALINRPYILLADEPTGNLDPRNSWEIMQLLEQVNREGTTILVVTHNREIVNAMHKRVITMKQGIIMDDEAHGQYSADENIAYEEEIYEADYADDYGDAGETGASYENEENGDYQ